MNTKGWLMLVLAIVVVSPAMVQSNEHAQAPAQPENIDLIMTNGQRKRSQQKSGVIALGIVLIRMLAPATLHTKRFKSLKLAI
jgi:hypothetical protein